MPWSRYGSQRTNHRSWLSPITWSKEPNLSCQTSVPLPLSHLIGLPKPEKMVDGCAASFLLFSSTTTVLLLSPCLCIRILFTSFSYCHNLWDRGHMAKGQREAMDHEGPFLYRYVQRHESPGETLQPKHGKQVLQVIFQRQFGQSKVPRLNLYN